MHVAVQRHSEGTSNHHRYPKSAPKKVPGTVAIWTPPSIRIRIARRIQPSVRERMMIHVRTCTEWKH